MSGPTKMNLKTPEYSSGSCNIGGAEVRRRKVSGVIGGVFAIIFYVACISLDAPKGIRALVFIPLVITWTGWLQSRNKFCMAFGLMGVFNFGRLGDASHVADAEARAMDRNRAMVLLAQAVALSLASALVFTFIPA